jgi:hypothetical protein
MKDGRVSQAKNSMLKMLECDSKWTPIEQRAAWLLCLMAGQRWTRAMQGTRQEAGAQINVL